MSKEELQKKINELREQSIVLYGKRIELERELEKILAKEFLASDLLKICTFTLTSARHLTITDVPHQRLSTFFVEATGGNYLTLTKGVTLYADFDDENYYIYADNDELMVDFIGDHSIKVHLEIKDKLLELQAEVEALEILLSIYS